MALALFYHEDRLLAQKSCRPSMAISCSAYPSSSPQHGTIPPMLSEFLLLYM